MTSDIGLLLYLPMYTETNKYPNDHIFLDDEERLRFSSSSLNPVIVVVVALHFNFFAQYQLSLRVKSF